MKLIATCELIVQSKDKFDRSNNGNVVWKKQKTNKHIRTNVAGIYYWQIVIYVRWKKLETLSFSSDYWPNQINRNENISILVFCHAIDLLRIPIKILYGSQWIKTQLHCRFCAHWRHTKMQLLKSDGEMMIV